ncbi:hypothetical protein MHU86_17657 [Fragilaria crotonensis]|nr:hypothetical protein MHU86_17657 [Fragilaria crotonensis]
MSLSALNSPPFIAAVGSGALALLPILEGMQFPFSTLKYGNFVAYCINFASVSVPGRIDGQQQSNAIEGGRTEMDQLSPGKGGRTLLAPSGWAFSIWAPIFMGELVLVTAQLFVGPNDSMAPFLKSASVPFMAANIFQSLWCSLPSQVHNAALRLIGWDYIIYGLPTSLHFGWVTAASLVNLNGAVAMQKEVSANTVAWVGHLSVVTATVLGILVTVSRQAPVYGGVICWALTAVADGMAKRGGY